MRYALQTITAVLILVCSNNLLASDPPVGDWPIGSTIALMDSTKTLMNSYGDPQNNWSLASFHAGIDIDTLTETPVCMEVRNVLMGNSIVTDAFAQSYDSGEMEGVVVIASGTSQYNHEDYGWAYEHLDIDGVYLWDQHSHGDVIASMHYDDDTSTITHTHFKWTFHDFDNMCYVNPLNFLDNQPLGSDFTWTFNPSGYSNSFEGFFLSQTEPSQWPETPGQVSMMNPNNLFGDVDAFLGFGLSGVGQSTTPNCGRNDLAPERIEWSIEYLTSTCFETIENRYLVNFDCPLSNTFDTRVQQLYFKFDYDQMFSYTSGDHEGLIVCLTNCGEEQGWEDLGIDNITENWWQTDCIIDDATETTVNPILAEYPDGSYQISATIYAHDPNVYQECDIPCELHNFHPALREVIISDAITDQTYYHGTWLPDGSGLEAFLDIDPISAAQTGANLEVVLIFTEEMNPSSIDVTLGPLDVTGGTWSGTVVDNDTWTGEVTLPGVLTDGNYTLLVTAEDTDDNELMDPEGKGTVGPYCDCHHALSLGFAAGVEWTRSLHADVHGSPKLADVDGDGDLEIAFQSIDGCADLRGDNGYSLPGWPNDHSLSPGDPLVTASPAFGNFTGSSYPEIIFMKEIGCNVWNASGVLQFPANWFRWTVNSSPVIADLDGDNSNEFLIGRQFQTETYNYMNLVAKETNGNTNMWYSDLGIDASVTATPSVCDVDNNSSGLEVIAVTDATEYSQTDGSGTVRCFTGSGGASRWNTIVNGEEITSAVVTANTDDDIQIEVIVAGVSILENQVKVLQGTTGYVEATFTVSGSVDAGVSVADINQDGYNDIVLSSSGNGGTLYCWGWNGSSYSSLTGFPVSLGTWTDDGVSIADIDSDSQLELVIAGKDGNLHAINHDGTAASGFPLAISGSNSLSGQPAIGDIDSDGRLEIVFFELNASVIHCIELGDNTANNYLPWPQFQHDAQNTGYFPTDDDPPAPPENPGGDLTIMGYKALVNLSWDLSPDYPDDVYAYRIYRTLLPYGSTDLIASVSPGTTAYFDAFRYYFNSKAYYYLTSWDGVSESSPSAGLALHIQSLNLISAGCPVEEIHASRTEQSLSGTAEVSSNRSNCSLLTDGLFNEPYSPSRTAECVEIDLGTSYQVENVSVIRNTAGGMNREGTESLALCSYSLSTDGNSFMRRETGAARYVRVYGTAGATEIEVYGTSDTEASSALIDVVRNDSGAFTAQSVTGEELTLHVFDLMGRTIWQGTSVDQVSWPSVNSSGNRVPAGVYLLRVESESMETMTAKVVVR